MTEKKDLQASTGRPGDKAAGASELPTRYRDMQRLLAEYSAKHGLQGPEQLLVLTAMVEQNMAEQARNKSELNLNIECWIVGFRHSCRSRFDRVSSEGKAGPSFQSTTSPSRKQRESKRDYDAERRKDYKKLLGEADKRNASSAAVPAKDE